jgi:hypothetical protein
MKWMNPECPRPYKARYGASMASEIHKNVTLQAGEEFLYSQFVRERKNLFMAQPRLLALTASRLLLLEHNLFAADWILEVPRSVVTDVFRDAGVMKNWVSFNYSDAGEDHTVRVQPMLRRVSEEENQKLFFALNAFHCGQLNSYALGTESVLC